MKLVKRIIYDSSCSYDENYIPSESKPGQLVDIMNTYDYVVEHDVKIIDGITVISTKSDDELYF